MALSISPAARENLKDLLICFSIGNLCFLRRWYDLEHLKEPSMDYYRTAPANPALLLATLCSALLLTGMFWAAWLLVKRSRAVTAWKLVRCGFLLILIYPLESVRRYWNTQGARPDPGSNAALLAIEAILGAGLVMALFGNNRIVRAAKRVALVLTLLVPSLLIDFTWARLSMAPAEAFAARPALPMLENTGRNPRRVIWLLFDEFDQRLAFDLRQPSVDLPELDRLRADSLVATRAHQTAGFTTMAVPCLLSGRLYSRVDLIDASTLRVYPEGSRRGESWHDQPNVFKRARELGVNAELVGWHHPYCRVLGDSLVRCLEVPTGFPTNAILSETSAGDRGTIREIPFLFWQQLENIAEIFRGRGEPGSSVWRDRYVQQRQQQQYFQIRDAAYAGAADPRIGLLFAHFPTPHFFGIYDRKRQDFTLGDRLSYADNLALVDRTVGELRRALERAGLWESTALLITSDHGLRPDVWRNHMGWTAELNRLTIAGQSEIVPFILRLPGQGHGNVFEQPFSGVAAADLVLGVLNGRISTYEGASDWLARGSTQNAFMR
jgi:hypothetical protein